MTVPVRLYQNWRQVTHWPWKNFSPRELACKGTGSILVDDVAIDALQKLRDDLGRPLVVVSAYRSQSHNRAVGGAKNSYHMRGCAFDISMVNHNPLEFEMAARKAGFTGFGYYPKSGFMHIDMGPPRVFGTPFKHGETDLPVERIPPHETPDRNTPVASTTVQAAATQIATGVGGAAAAVSTLHGTAQIVALVAATVVILAALWIMRERLAKWAAGDK
jgi:zinc D-Ala-D-Ala carboxypeptidase